VLTAFEISSLLALKTILIEFRTLSGLSTNYEKTAIMRIGNTTSPIPEEFDEVGFMLVDKIKLLGFNISNQDNINALNFEPVTTRIANIVKFWERFYLSLSGRIMVYKTLLLPQINYIASILKYQISLKI
jgi:hypothetical protein